MNSLIPKVKDSVRKGTSHKKTKSNVRKPRPMEDISYDPYALNREELNAVNARKSFTHQNISKISPVKNVLESPYKITVKGTRVPSFHILKSQGLSPAPKRRESLLMTLHGIKEKSSIVELEEQRDIRNKRSTNIRENQQHNIIKMYLNNPGIMNRMSMRYYILHNQDPAGIPKFESGRGLNPYSQFKSIKWK